jgi:hypothetical protein
MMPLQGYRHFYRNDPRQAWNPIHKVCAELATLCCRFVKRFSAVKEFCDAPKKQP